MQMPAARPLLVGAVAIVILLSRLAFLPGAGYGTDPDAWRLALAGRIFARTGEYSMSRPPGYPLVELVATAVSSAPPWFFCLLTAVIGSAGCACLARLLWRLDVAAWLPLTLGFALTPVVCASSTNSMDYVWGASLFLAACLLLADCHLVGSGILLGLAVAARPATAALAPTLLVVLALGEGRHSWRPWFRFIIPAALAGLALFAFPLACFGLSAITAYPVSATPRQIVERGTVLVWGQLGAAAVAVALLAGCLRLLAGRRLTSGQQTSWALGAVAGLATQAIVFVRLPDDPGYLVAAAAVALLLVGLLCPPPAAAAVVVCVGLSAFLSPPISAPQTGNQQAQSDVRRAGVRLVERIATQVEALPPGAVVVAGPQLPQLLATLRTLPPASRDTAGHLTRLVLSGGQVLSYCLANPDRTAATIYATPAGRPLVGRVPGRVVILGAAVPPAAALLTAQRR